MPIRAIFKQVVKWQIPPPGLSCLPAKHSADLFQSGVRANFGKFDRLHEADSSVLLLGRDDQLAVSVPMGLAGHPGVLGRAVCQNLVALSVYSLCTYPFATYLTVQNSNQVGASILIKIPGINLY